MAMITYPLNDVEYTAEDAELYNSTRSSGVYSGEDFSCTVSGTNNNVTISEGIGWIRNSRFSGKVFANKAPITLALDIADAAYSRIDVIAVRFDAATNSTDFVIKKGEASATPVMPEMTQTEAVYELYLYSIYRPAAAVAIGADDVTDLRLDESYCGLMADAVTSVDTSTINAQFTALLAKIKQELADLKHDKIDAYTKAETLSPATKTALGLSEDAVPDDAFAQFGLHWWRRRAEKSGYTVQETAFAPYNLTAYNIYVFDTFEVNEQTGEVTISKTSVFMEAYTQLSNYASAVRGKYFITNASYSEGDTIYHISENAQFQNYAGEYTIISELSQINVVKVTNVGEYEYVTSPNRHAYPDSGTDDIFSYSYLGVPFENAREGAAKAGDTLTTLRTELDDKWLLANGDTISLADYPGLDSENIKTLALSQGTLAATGSRVCRVDEQNILICTNGEIYTFTEPSQGFSLVATLPVGEDKFYSHKLIHKGGYWVCVGYLGSYAYSFAAENLSGTWYASKMGSEAGSCTCDVDYYNGVWVAAGQATSSNTGYIWHTTNPITTWTQKDITGGGYKTYAIIYHNGTWICGGSDTSYNKGYARVWTATDPSGTWKVAYQNSSTVSSYGAVLPNMRFTEHEGTVYLIYGSASSKIIVLESNDNGTSWTLHSKTSSLSPVGIIDVYFDNNKWYIVTSDANYAVYVYTAEDIVAGQWQGIYNSTISGQRFVGYLPLGADDWIAVHGNAYKTRKLVKLPTITVNNAYTYIKAKE